MIAWGDKIKEMIPSYGLKLADNHDLFEEQWERSQKALNLERD